MQPYPTTTQVATLLNVTRPTVARYIRQGWLRGSRIGRTWRVDPDSVHRLLAIGMGSGDQRSTSAEQN